MNEYVSSAQDEDYVDPRKQSRGPGGLPPLVPIMAGGGGEGGGYTR